MVRVHLDDIVVPGEHGMSVWRGDRLTAEAAFPRKTPGGTQDVSWLYVRAWLGQ